MSLTLTRKVLKMQASSLASYAFGSAFYAVLIVVLYQQFVQQHRSVFEQYVKVAPKALLQMFNISGGNLATLGGFLGAEYLSFIWVIVIAIFVISFATGALVRELEQGTLELMLAYPISRLGFYLSKVAALVVGVAIIVGVTILAIWLSALDQNLHLTAGAYAAISALMMSFAFAIAGYSLLFSALDSQRSRAAGVAAGLTVLFYAINFVSQVLPQLSGLRWLSLFKYFTPDVAIDTGRADPQSVAVLAGIGVVGAIAGAIVFRQRDLSV
jgi:ABC-2 type transport system permease protein